MIFLPTSFFLEKKEKCLNSLYTNTYMNQYKYFIIVKYATSSGVVVE